jgi:type VI secretion system protein ImpC
MSRATMNTGGTPIGMASDQNTPKVVRNRPCHILALADFSGRSHRDEDDASGLCERNIVEVTRDNVDDVFVRMGVTLDLAVADKPIQFLEMDDLHPDYIYERVDLFSQFRSLKRRLKNKDTFETAAQEILSWANAPKVKTPATDKQETYPTDDVLDMLLHSTRAQAESANSIHSMIQQIVAPYVIPSADPRQAELMETVDQAASHLMRKILHSSAFQSIESSWRGMYWMLKQLETDQDLRLFIADISLQEIIDDNEAYPDSLTQLHKLLVERRIGTGSVPFSVVIADYQFQDQVQHCEALANLGSAAADSHAVLVAGGSVRLAGCEQLVRQPDPDDWVLHGDRSSDFCLLWEAIREQDYSQYIVLTAPQFMLRLPYGKNTSPLESLKFEELPEQGRHDYYLWGNGAWLVGAQLGQYYAQQGWSQAATGGAKITQLPLHVYYQQGESHVMPCAELAMTDVTANALAAQGLLPIRSVKDEDSVLIPGLRSISSITENVLGPWSEVL